jgi:hypothetical protein
MTATALSNSSYRNTAEKGLEVRVYDLINKFSKIYLPQYHPAARFTSEDFASELYVDMYRVKRGGKTLLEKLDTTVEKGRLESYIKMYVITHLIDAARSDKANEMISIDTYVKEEGDNWTERGDSEVTTTAAEEVPELLSEDLDIIEAINDNEVTIDELVDRLSKMQSTTLRKVRTIYDDLTRENALTEEAKNLYEGALKVVEAKKVVKSNNEVKMAKEEKEKKEAVTVTVEVNGKSYEVTEGSRAFIVLNLFKENDVVTKKTIAAAFEAEGKKASAVDIFLRNCNYFEYDKTVKQVKLA